MSELSDKTITKFNVISTYMEEGFDISLRLALIAKLLALK